MNHQKILCLFGTYESRFPRTKTIIYAALKNGYRIEECHLPFWEKTKEKHEFFSLQSLAFSLLKLVLAYFRLIMKYTSVKEYDAMIVGYNGYFDVPLAKILARLKKKPLVFTPVFPLYETMVEDRAYVKRNSFKSRLIHKVDEIGCRLSDHIIIETEEYMKYYHREFGVPLDKFIKIPLGADESNYYPRPERKKSEDTVKVLFYGKFIPLQGIEYIVRAAKILEADHQITFEVIGSGQLTEKIRQLSKELKIKNIVFFDWVSYQDLPFHIRDADICLGIFGSTPKARRGIPIKVYEAMAMKKPIITGDSPAAREVFTSGHDAVLCRMGDEKALAQAIVMLKNDNMLREKVAQNAHSLYQKIFSSDRLAEDLKNAVDTILERKN